MACKDMSGGGQNGQEAAVCLSGHLFVSLAIILLINSDGK